MHCNNIVRVLVTQTKVYYNIIIFNNFIQLVVYQIFGHLLLNYINSMPPRKNLFTIISAKSPLWELQPFFSSLDMYEENVVYFFGCKLLYLILSFIWCYFLAVFSMLYLKKMYAKNIFRLFFNDFSDFLEIFISFKIHKS